MGEKFLDFTDFVMEIIYKIDIILYKLGEKIL
ncbi:hypothetical protein B0F89_11155 [Malaciobacter marinus]|jgi:hypothetical protein|uniref:Uncharacterized protein n=1 Tax=Malaciobacter marinus TaxID=505249 RepID=A0AB36ZZK4_9BACT|nr:hypothetical protein B0F89_11155 [Malaciobacter marinus]SKB61345.1 hypothetical protein SAMN06295997_12355 [Malaciobacter marinus]